LTATAQIPVGPSVPGPNLKIENQQFKNVPRDYLQVGQVHSSIYPFPGPPCSGVLVAPTKVLTVFHCISENGSLPKNLIYVSGNWQKIEVATWSWEGRGRLPRALPHNATLAQMQDILPEELVLLTLSKPVVGIDPLPILNNKDWQTNSAVVRGNTTAVGFPGYSLYNLPSVFRYSLELRFRAAVPAGNIAQFNGVVPHGFSGGGIFVKLNETNFLLAISYSSNENAGTTTALVPMAYPLLMSEIAVALGGRLQE